MTKFSFIEPTSWPIGVAAFACLSMALVFMACEDPSNVGIGLVDQDEGGLPEVRTVDPTDVRNAPLPRMTGSHPRVLAGRVDDPLVGTVESEGYFDLGSTSSPAFRAGEVQSAALRLNPTYVYGDTTAQVRFAIRQISENWQATGLPADTSFTSGAVISEFEFVPTDSIVVFSLPESWISENDAVLRSEDFADRFHGFRIEQVSGNAIVGFAGQSQLRAFTSADSAVFPVTRMYSAARRVAEPTLPPGRILYQALAGPSIAFQFDLDQDVIADVAINRAKLVFYTDSLSLSQKPAGFLRPVITTLDLYGVMEGERLVLIDRADVDADGRFIFDGSGLAAEMQRVLLGTRSFDRFELRLPVGQGSSGQTTPADVLGSIDVQLFYDMSVAERAPAGFFTITPLD